MRHYKFDTTYITNKNLHIKKVYSRSCPDLMPQSHTNSGSKRIKSGSIWHVTRVATWSSVSILVGPLAM